MASRGFITPFTVGFAVCLIPTAFFFVYGYKAPEDRVKELVSPSPSTLHSS